MNSIYYANGSLHVEGFDVGEVADQFSTPLYIYSATEILGKFNEYRNAIQEDGLVCFAVKANNNLGILKLLKDAGAGFDIVSGGELERVLAVGADPKKIVFSGVGKQAWEIEKALNADIFCFNVESESELRLIRSIGLKRGLTGIPVSLRVNPDVDAKTHPYISTGLSENKFGIEVKTAEKLFLEFRADPIVDLTGIDCHIGSQISDILPFKDAVNVILDMVEKLREQEVRICHVDIGGGLGVKYSNESPPSPSEYLKAILAEIRKRNLMNLKVIVEPGRSIVANAGILVTRVLFLKSNSSKNFCVVDAAMTDLIRPSLYNAHHGILKVKNDPKDEVTKDSENDASTKIWDIVGPVCETGDFLAKNRTLSLREGDLLAVMSAGAYGSSMSMCQYNSRPRAAELLVEGKKIRLIRRRETIEDLMAHEICSLQL